MSDYAHKQTDKLLEKLEKSVAAVYKTVGVEMAEQLAAFLDRFKEQDETKREQVQEGTLSDSDYRAWRKHFVEHATQYTTVVENAAEIAHKANTAAQEIVNGSLPKIYALNQNFMHYTIESQMLQAGFKMGFVNEQSVIRLLRDNPDLFPAYKLDALRDISWNTQKIRETISAGLLQGKPMKNIAADLSRVAGMNRNSALLHAQTAVTGAENAGRQAGFKRAEELGIEFEREWIATLDSHTRDSHRKLDGQRVGVNEPFRSMYGEIMYPGDPHADSRDVWRCRCSVGVRVKGASAGQRRAKRADGGYDVIEYKTYKEWEAANRG